MSARNFSNVSLLITHYNRSSSLIRLLSALRGLKCNFGEIIVSDDCSKDEHLLVLKSNQLEFGYKLITSEVNKGLGNNINKGQDAVTKEYTVYIQEDFVPTALFPQHFFDALSLMDEYLDMDIARFYGYVPYPYTKPFFKGYRLMNFNFFYPGYLKFYTYSDHPHLRRSTFFNKFGRYKEGVNGDLTEFNMCLSFLKSKGKGFFYPQISALFLQLNDSAEPSTADFRKEWRLSSNWIVRALRRGYLQYKTLKYHVDYLMFRVKK